MTYLKRIALWAVIAFVLFAFWYQGYHGEHRNSTTRPAKPATCPSPGTWVKVQYPDEFPYWECEYP